MVEKNKFPQIILINPQLPENIGMSARAMMNCGFQNLRIVNPREKWPNESAIKSSAHAKNIIKKSSLFYQALQDQYLAFVFGPGLLQLWRALKDFLALGLDFLILELGSPNATRFTFLPAFTNTTICDLPYPGSPFLILRGLLSLTFLP